MISFLKCFAVVVCFSVLAAGQSPRLWVLTAPDSAIEYDPASFSRKQVVTVPVDVLKSPKIFQVNREGQMLYAPNSEDPSPDVGKSGERFWFWNGHAASMLGREMIRVASPSGSNQKVSESSPWPFLSADGAHLFWFTNQHDKLERDNVELSVTTSFHAWESDLGGKQKQNVATIEFPECRCDTGVCTETCPEGSFWTPEGGVADYFVLTRMIQGQTETRYLSTSIYRQAENSWAATDLKEPLQRVLDASDHGGVILGAILDTGCCGWENQSNDQTVLWKGEKRTVVFDERLHFKNPDYDVSFFTENAKLSPDLTRVAMTVVASAKSSAPIQLSEDGQANPAESLRIRKALGEVPEVEVVSSEDATKRTSVPHAYLVGWLNEKEILIVENQVLVAYNIAAGTRRRSTIKVQDPAVVVLR
jgi:hypothetical protein